MTKGLWDIVSGEAYQVRANSEDEALAIFHIAQGNMEHEDYPEFKITDEDLSSVEYLHAETVADFVLEL
jgi:hypothetical protein